jgi:DNA polymerase II large subunit
MKHLELYEGFITLFQEKKKEGKDLKWIQKAIKKPGALHKKLGIPEDQKISMETLDTKIKELNDKNKDDEKLSKKDSKFLRRLQLAKNLKSL